MVCNTNIRKPAVVVVKAASTDLLGMVSFLEAPAIPVSSPPPMFFNHILLSRAHCRTESHVCTPAAGISSSFVIGSYHFTVCLV